MSSEEREARDWCEAQGYPPDEVAYNALTQTDEPRWRIMQDAIALYRERIGPTPILPKGRTDDAQPARLSGTSH
jgi:hypothetical protein